MSRIETKLTDMGMPLPDVPAPAGAYIPASQSGNSVYTSGQLPIVDGELYATGHVGCDVGVEDAAKAARIATLNALAAIKQVIGDLDNIVRIVKVTGFVSSAPDFTEQAKVLNGASEFLHEVFGAAGQHVRSAVGVSALPLNTPVEVELLVTVRPNDDVHV